MANSSSGTPTIQHTLTGLNRWSVADKQLPPVATIKALHVYDFDNTVFHTPLPNAKLWNGPSIGFLQTKDTFATGGWWHDHRILAATGSGAEIEEARAWDGWWNERVVELIQLSMKQKDALTVLLTGRAESNFTDLVKRIVRSKGLDFDIICLQPMAGPNNQKFSSTMYFKQAFLESLMETYREAEEMRVYEDRVAHVKNFRGFFTDYNTRQNGVAPTRGPITAEVVQVVPVTMQLDPVQETAEVQRIINDHNAAISKGRGGRRMMIKKTVFYTGYLIKSTDTQRLLTLVQPPPNMPDTEMKYLANNVLITPRPCPNSILEKVGGMGSKTTWEITGTAVFENKVWAAQVRPVPETQKYYTENRIPIVVLAVRKGARPIDAGKIQNWQPVPPEKHFVFETTVGEKNLLRIEDEDPHENEYESLFPNKSFKRKHAQDDESSNRQPSGSYGGQNTGGRGGGQQNFGGRGGRGRGQAPQRGNRGGRGGGGGRGRGRGGGYHYRSLDDVGERSSSQAVPPPKYDVSVAYEDFPPLQKQYQTPQQLVQQQFDQYNQYQQKIHKKGGNAGDQQQQGAGDLPYF